MKSKTVKILATVSCICTIVAIILATFALQLVKRSDDYVNFDKNKLNEVYANVVLLDCFGNKIDKPLQLNGTKQIPLSALPKHAYMAFVCVEDKRFFKHDGIDYKRCVGALIHNVKSMQYKEGASTISQQLIKNTHLDTSKTLKRKLNEMFLAKQLEKNYSKTEILEMYLNTIYFGRNAYGIENASNVYFNKSASQLTVGESATLAGMIKAPNVYAPDKNSQKCKARRDSVLKTMLQQKIITSSQYQNALKSQVNYQPQRESESNDYVSLTLKEACKLLNCTQRQLAKSRVQISTNYNPILQEKLNKCVLNDDFLTNAEQNAQLSCILCDKLGGVNACYLQGEDALTPKQIGSTAKPFAVYAPALNERLITQASPVLDEQTDFGGYKPKNSNGYNGWTTVKNAISKSLNIPAIKTLNALSLPIAEKYLAKLGIEGEQNLSLALGNVTNGINILQLAKCYCTLANDGKCNDTHFVTKISKNGKILYQYQQTNTPVFTQSANYLMTDMLISAVNHGTAKQLRSNYQIAGKTGTVGNKNGNNQALVAGYTTKNTFVVWYSGQFGNEVNGGTKPCHFAKNLLDDIYKDAKPADFTPPVDIIKLGVDKNKLYNDQIVLANKDGEQFLFDVANQPKNTLPPSQLPNVDNFWYWQ